MDNIIFQMFFTKSNRTITPRTFYRTLALASTILFPRYPCYCFPAYLLVQVYNKLVSLQKNKRFRLLPAPKKLVHLLTDAEFLKSEHYCFVSESIYDDLVKLKDLNWINLVFNDISESNGSINDSENIVQTILNKPNSTVLVPVLPATNCQSNCVFVSENCFQNFCAKFKLNSDRPICVSLQPFGEDQMVPRMASRATIFLVKNPYDLPFDATDEILSKYFSEPRILYRNHTYEIVLDDLMLDASVNGKYFGMLSYLRKIYFRCVHLESTENPFEIVAVVVKGSTTLHQTTSINYPIPRQHLDDLCSIPLIPWGLSHVFEELKSSLMPFVGDISATATCVATKLDRKQTTGQSNGPQLLANGIYPMFLVQGEPGSGKKQLASAIANYLGLQQFSIHCADIVSPIPAQTEAKLKLALAKANCCEPLIVVLHNFEMFGVDHEGRGDLRILSAFQNELYTLFGRDRTFPLIVLAMTSAKTINPLLRRQFLDVVRVQPPNDEQRYEHFQWLFHKEVIAQEIFNKKNVENVPLFNGLQMDRAKFYLSRYFVSARGADIFRSLADKTKGFLFGDIKLLFENSLKKMLVNNSWEQGLDLAEFEKNLATMQTEFSTSLGAPKVPRVLWSDIGGLIKLKDEIQSSIGLPLKHMHLMGKNMRRSGILLYGPPGKLYRGNSYLNFRTLRLI